MERRRIVAILFLAHQGVSQSGVWKVWKNKMDEFFDIRYHVVCPENPLYGASFCRTHRLTLMGPTAWGSFSIVYETIRALCQLYTEYNAEERFFRLFIVSGSDIPIQDLRAFDFIDREVIGMRAIPSTNEFKHSQWMCLTPLFLTHIYDRYHDMNYILLILFYQCLLTLQSYPNLAPDEIWLNFVEYDRRRFSTRHILLPFYHDSNLPISPITWNDLRLKQYRREDGKGMRMNLVEAIYLSRSRGYCFFRKVGPTVRFPLEFLHELFDVQRPTPIPRLQRVPESQRPTPQRPPDQRKNQQIRRIRQQFIQQFFPEWDPFNDTLLERALHSNFRQSQMMKTQSVPNTFNT